MAIRGEQVIYKYSLGNGVTGKRLSIEMPFGAHILDVQIQRHNVNLERVEDRVMIWAVVDKDSIDVRPRNFWVLGTGWDIPKGVVLEHISTVQTKGGLVWHIFEEPRY